MKPPGEAILPHDVIFKHIHFTYIFSPALSNVGTYRDKCGLWNNLICVGQEKPAEQKIKVKKEEKKDTTPKKVE